MRNLNLCFCDHVIDIDIDPNIRNIFDQKSWRNAYTEGTLLSRLKSLAIAIGGPRQHKSVFQPLVKHSNRLENVRHLER